MRPLLAILVTAVLLHGQQGVYSSPPPSGSLILRGKGTYDQMTATTASTGDVWLLTNALSSGVCSSGGATNSGYAICIRDGNGVWQPILAIGGAGTGGGGGTPTGTTYGSWTGGGATVTVSDADCAGSDDTTTLVTRIGSLADNGTLDFQNTTSPCDVGSVGALNITSKTNVRVTHSPSTHPTGGDLRGANHIIYTNEYSTLLRLHTCTNCLVDKLQINLNQAYAQGIFCHFCTASSIQNTKVYDVASNGCETPGGCGADPQMVHGAQIRVDGGTGNFIVSNVVTNATAAQAGVNGGHGARGIWAGVGSEYETNIVIKDNTVSNTGHTGLVSESQAPVVTGNTVSNQTIQGTCLKSVPRGSSTQDQVWDGNSCNTVANAGGIQVDSSATKPTHIYIRNNTFKSISSGACCFGALYLTGSTSGGNQNVFFTGNTIDNGYRVGNLNNAHFITVANNTITNPLVGGGDNGTSLDLDDQDTDIYLINSGHITVGGGGSGFARIYQDGTTIVAYAMPRRSPWAPISA